MALSSDDKKDPGKIKTALLNSFDNAKQNRGVAIGELRHRMRLKDENAEVFAHKIQELLKNGYPRFDEPSRASLPKVHLLRWWSDHQPAMQKELRKLADLENKALADLIKQTTYFEIAGANTARLQSKTEVIATVNASNSRIEKKLDRPVTLLE